MKAIAAGNPAVLTLAEADAELQRLALLKKNHLDEQYVARRSVRDLPGRIAAINDRIERLATDEATATDHAHDPVSIGKHSLSREDLPAVLGRRLESLPRDVRDTTRMPIGTYRGLAFGLVLHPSFPPDVYLEGATTRTYGLSREHQGPRAVLNAVERIAASYDSEIVRIRQDAGIAQSQLRDYQERLGKLFAHEAYLNELASLRDALKTALTGRDNEAKPDGGPSTSELAAHIKALKAANTVESAAPRSDRKAVAAEEPIAARIRRRQEESSAATDSAATTPPEQAPQPATTSFAERIRREGEQKAEGEGQSPP